jgi:puromycin-sensitive aminopeptidase
LKYTLDNKWKTINIEFPQEIGPQKAKLSIDYKAEITQKMNGLYRSSYKASDGSTKYIASTQFESDTARSVFPSFDEPLYKATFDIQMEVDEKLTALSNMNVIEETKLGEGTKLVRFATTPIMSTYLIAVAIGDFEYIETTYGQNNIPIRVYTLPGKKETTKFCLEVAKQSMEWFEDWFDYKSPIPKVDLIAIPDFSMGAMENWGLVTFREILLLVDKETTHRRKAMCALTTAHELGHFWFGNLTTMEWWCDLWLKEGFASFMEYLFVSRLYPEMKTSIDYLSDVTSSALYLDSLRSSHKIEVEINDPNELTGIYDDITYSKSNAIIRQLYYYLGEETFREGLRLYIKRFAFKNAVTQDLWTALSDASHQDINKLMSCWTQQIGYPLITVREEKLEGGKRRLHLRQTRYLADGSTDEQTLWQIPITIIKTSNVTEPVRFLMTQAEQEIVLDNVASDEWVKLNADTSGFYRVQYSEDMLKHLLGAIHSGKLGVLDRFGLVSDLFAIVKSGRAPASQFLELVAALVNENELIIWRCVESGKT